MPKSEFTGYQLFVKAKVLKWKGSQDFPSKYDNLSEKKQAKFEQLAAQINEAIGSKPKAVAMPALVEKKKDAPKKKRQLSGLGFFSKYLRKKWKTAWCEGGDPVPIVTTKEMKARYAALSPEKRAKCERKAAEINAQ